MGVRMLGSRAGHDPPQLLQANTLADSLVAAASAAAAAVAEEVSAVQRLLPVPYGDSQDDGTGRHVHADGGSRVERRRELQKGLGWLRPLRGQLPSTCTVREGEDHRFGRSPITL